MNPDKSTPDPRLDSHLNRKNKRERNQRIAVVAKEAMMVLIAREDAARKTTIGIVKLAISYSKELEDQLTDLF